MASSSPAPGELIRSRLAALRRLRLANDLPALLLLATGLLAAGVALVSLLFWSGWLLLALLPVFGFVVRRWLAGLGRRRLAYAVEAAHPALAGRLVAALDLSRRGETREAYSPELQQAAVRAVEADLRGIPLGRLCRRRRILLGGLAAALGVGLLLAGRIALPLRLEVGLVNAFARDRLRVGFSVTPGDTAVLPGTGLELACRVEPAGLFRTVSFEQPGRRTKRIALADGVARVPLYATRDQQYRFRVLGAVSATHRVRVLEPLGIEELGFITRPPPHTGLPERSAGWSPAASARETGAELAVPVGSEITFQGRANREFASGRLAFAADTVELEPGPGRRPLYPPDLPAAPFAHWLAAAESNPALPIVLRLLASDLNPVSGFAFWLLAFRANPVLTSALRLLAPDAKAAPSGPGFSGAFTVRDSDRGSFELRAEEGGEYQPCGLLVIRALADEPPLVRVLRPGRDTDLPMSMQLPLLVNSLDDYGLGALWLRWGRDSLDTRLRIKSLAGRREDTTLYAWDLSGLGLLPGEAVRYRLEVTDNDLVSGPKTGWSETWTVRFPTMGEIFNASVRQTEHTRSELEPLRDLQERLTEEVGRLGDQARGTGELSWEERQALGDLLAEQQDLAGELADLREQVREMLDNIYEGVAFDEETVMRLAELQQLLTDLLPRELSESLDRLREQLGESSPELRRALEQFRLDQEEFRRSLDSALEFLRQVMEEQRLEALARTAEELARREEDIARRAQNEPAPGLGREQEALARALDSLLAGVADLAREMSDPGTAEALAELADAAGQDELSPMAHEAAARFREDQARPGQQQAAQVAQKLGELGQSLADLGSELKQSRSAEAAGQLLAAAEELLMLSREQEQLAGELAPGPDPGPAIARGMALHDATGVIAESLAALSGRTMALPGRLVGELGRARRLMKAAGQDLLESRTGQAAGQMNQARAALDRVAAGLLEAMADTREGGGMSGGLEGLMEALSRMAAGQMSVNAGMGAFPLPMPGGMSPGLADALGRLLGQQAALREQLEQLLEQMGGQRPGLTSALDGVLEEMKAVERDLAELNIDRELIERQEGILSRLLDARRSIRQRGQEEEREAQTAQAFEREPVPALPEDRGERNRLLREELMRALREGRLGRFEPQVRAYFERLLQEQ